MNTTEGPSIQELINRKKPASFSVSAGHRRRDFKALLRQHLWSKCN